MGDERKLKFSQTLSPKLNVGLSFVINYIILLWHNCSDNLKLWDFKQNRCILYVCLSACMYVFTYVFTGGVSKDQLFLHASREMDSISFP